MNYNYVYLGCNNDYDTITYRECKKVVPNLYWCKDPYHRYGGIKLFIFSVHNSTTINRIIKLPFRRLWASSFLTDDVEKQLKAIKEQPTCFICNGFVLHYSENKIENYLRRKFPNCILIALLDDKVTMYQKLYGMDVVEKLKSRYDAILTYNQADVRNYDFTYSPPCLIDFSFVENDMTIPESDVFFIGRDKGRMKKLVEIYDVCEKAGLRCLFFISGVENEKKVIRDGIVYNQTMSYEEILKYSKRTKCIVNYTQEGAEGITLRDYEAVGMQKVLLTNNPVIKTSKLYSPWKVIEADHIEEQIYKIKEADKFSWPASVNQCSATRYYDWLNSELDILMKKRNKDK